MAELMLNIVLGLLAFAFGAGGATKTMAPEEKLREFFSWMEENSLEVIHVRLLGAAELAGGLTVGASMLVDFVPEELVLAACVCFGLVMIGAFWFTRADGLKGQIHHVVILAMSAYSSYQLI